MMHLRPKCDRENPPRQGDMVRLVHSPGLEGVVSSVADDLTVMLSMLIAGRYQLRGPFAFEDVAPASTASGPPEEEG